VNPWVTFPGFAFVIQLSRKCRSLSQNISSRRGKHHKAHAEELAKGFGATALDKLSQMVPGEVISETPITFALGR